MDSATKNFFSYQHSFPLKNRLGITTGDSKGVGYQVALKSLNKLGPQKHFQFLVWTAFKAPTLKIPSFKTKVFKTAKEALKDPFKEQVLLQIKSKKGAGDWVEEAAYFCLNKILSALITGPVSKATMKKNKHRKISQTPLLKKISGAKNVFMVFRGQFFNVILLTDHCPLKKIHIESQTLIALLKSALDLRSYLKPTEQKKPLGLLGLNPHSGENGLIGTEEKQILIPILKNHFKKEVKGPLVPDTAFLKKEWERYSFYVALYHDQGLIPFKTIHQQRGYALSLGLPFLRLGVDHGLGLGLSTKDICFQSFFSAIKEALKIIKNKVKP